MCRIVQDCRNEEVAVWRATSMSVVTSASVRGWSLYARIVRWASWLAIVSFVMRSFYDWVRETDRAFRTFCAGLKRDSRCRSFPGW